MDCNFSQLKSGALVAVRIQLTAGLHGYWYLEGRVRMRRDKGRLTVAYEDFAGHARLTKFDLQGFPVRPDGTVERTNYEQYGGRLVPLTDEIRRIFKYEKILGAIWNLTYADLLLMHDYELDFIGSLLQEAKGRGEKPDPVP
jgi:hypothetical protein